MAKEEEAKVLKRELGEFSEAIVPGLDLFESPLKQYALTKSRYQTYHPVTSVDRDAPLEFNLYSDSEYIDLHSAVLYIQSAIQAEDASKLSLTPTGSGTPAVPLKSLVYPINYYHATRFKSIEVYMNNTKISESDTLYPYRAYLETLFGTDKYTQDNELSMALWFKDDVTNMNYIEKDMADAAPDETKINVGAAHRFFLTKGSGPFEATGKIHVEMSNQSRFLMTGVPYKLRFIRADDKFALMSAKSDAKYYVPIMRAKLIVKQYQAITQLKTAHEIIINNPASKRVTYPVQRVLMKSYTIGPNRMDLSENSLYKGSKLPRTVIVGFVNSKAANGHFHHNPFHFHHYNITSIKLKKNGIPIGMPIELNFDTKMYQQGYVALLRALDKLYSGTSVNINAHEWAKGYTLFGFDLSVTSSKDCEDRNDDEGGTLALEVTTSKTTEHSVTAICYLEFDSNIFLVGNSKEVDYKQ